MTTGIAARLGRRLDPLGERDAVAAGQHHVHQHEVGADRVDAVEGRRAVGLEHEVDRLRFEHGGDERVQHLVVLDDEDDRSALRGCGAGRRRRWLGVGAMAAWPAGRSATRAGRWSRAGPGLPVPEVLDVVVDDAVLAQARAGGGAGGVAESEQERRRAMSPCSARAPAPRHRALEREDDAWARCERACAFTWSGFMQVRSPPANSGPSEAATPRAISSLSTTEGCGKGRRARRTTWRPDSVRCRRLGRRAGPANVTNARHAARRRRGEAPMTRCYTFAMVTRCSVRHQVARPGSLALAPLPVVGAPLIAAPGRLARAPSGSGARCRPARSIQTRCRRRRGPRDVETRPSAGRCDDHRTRIQEPGAQGYNRIPLIAEAFADLETPLSLYLKLANADARLQLPARIGGRRRALRPLFVHRPAGAHAAARDAAVATEVVDDGEVVETHDGDPLDVHRAPTSSASRSRCGPGCRASAAGWPATSATTRCATSSRKLARDAASRGGLGTPDILLLLCRRARGHRQPVGPALPDRLRRPGAARGAIAQRASGACANCADKLRAAVTAPPVDARRRRTPVEREFAKADYLARCARAKEYIAAGDMMQVQIGQRMRKPLHRLAAVAVSRAALAQPVAVHVLLRLRRLPGRRRVARDPGAPARTRPTATR